MRSGDVDLSVSEGSSLKVLTPRSTEDSECVVRFLDPRLFGTEASCIVVAIIELMRV